MDADETEKKKDTNMQFSHILHLTIMLNMQLVSNTQHRTHIYPSFPQLIFMVLFERRDLSTLLS
uniref:Uncharacterized protein n=1 Tax=Arundo donax TaxID=35708 RepID=A0A0A9DEW4_ARUDO